MEIFDSSKSILENLYYLSGILILVSIVIGLIQLSFAKKTLIINSKRDAASLAAKQVSIYMTEVIPLQNKLSNIRTEQNIKKVEIEVGEFNATALKEKMGEESFLKALNERIKLVSSVSPVLNSMEAFAVYFIKGVADEEIAFSSVGATYVYSVEFLYFDIALYRGEAENKNFQNLVKLYDIWSKRIEVDKLEKHQKSLTERIKDLKFAGINPIGTK